MVNSIEEFDKYMSTSANSVEWDVDFDANGTAVKTFHGAPCDCLRKCNESAPFADYLDYIREAVSLGNGPFRGKLLLLFLDLKLSTVPAENKRAAGVDVAQKLIGHLWKGVPPRKRINVLLGVQHTTDKDMLSGAIETISEVDQTLFDVIGFNVGFNDPLKKVAQMFNELGIQKHRWQGDGVTNCLSTLRPLIRLRKIIENRDGNVNDSFVDKVFSWTVDIKLKLRRELGAGVDAIITNMPDRLSDVINEPKFANDTRLANEGDSPWRRFVAEA